MKVSPSASVSRSRNQTFSTANFLDDADDDPNNHNRAPQHNFHARKMNRDDLLEVKVTDLGDWTMGAKAQGRQIVALRESPTKSLLVSCKRAAARAQGHLGPATSIRRDSITMRPHWQYVPQSWSPCNSPKAQHAR